MAGALLGGMLLLGAGFIFLSRRRQVSSANIFREPTEPAVGTLRQNLAIRPVVPYLLMSAISPSSKARSCVYLPFNSRCGSEVAREENPPVYGY